MLYRKPFLKRGFFVNDKKLYNFIEKVKEKHIIKNGEPQFSM